MIILNLLLENHQLVSMLGLKIILVSLALNKVKETICDHNCFI
eukprot:UN11247